MIWLTCATNYPACPEDAGKLLVVDGLYSMEGDIAPLPEIIPLCQEYNVRLNGG